MGFNPAKMQQLGSITGGLTTVLAGKAMGNQKLMGSPGGQLGKIAFDAFSGGASKAAGPATAGALPQEMSITETPTTVDPASMMDDSSPLARRFKKMRV